MSQQWANYVNQTVATFPAQFGITTNDASNFGYLIHEYGQGANLACQSCLYNGTSAQDCLNSLCGLTEPFPQIGHNSVVCLDQPDCYGCATTPQAQYMCNNFTPHPTPPPPPAPPAPGVSYNCGYPNPCPVPVRHRASKDYVNGVRDTF